MLTIKNQAARCWAFAFALLLLLAGCTPPGPRALLAGKKLLDEGKPREAAEEFKMAASVMPTNALAFNYLGLACQASGQSAEAERAYLRALALNPEFAEVHFNLGCLYLEQNKLAQAKSEFIVFTLRRGNSPEGFVKLGTVHLRFRETSPAERNFSEAIKLEPKGAEALTGLGLAKLQRNRVAEAVQLFRRALEVQPDYRPALQNLAVVAQEQLKDLPLARQYYSQLLALKPPPAEASAIKTIIRNIDQELTPRPAPAPPAHAVAVVQPSPSTSGTVPKVGPTGNAAQSHLKAKPEPAAVPAAQPPATNVAKAAPPAPVRTTPLAEPAVKPTPTQDPQKTSAATAQPKPAAPAPVAPAAPLEVVRVADATVFKPGQDPTPASTSSTAKAAPSPTPGPAASKPTTVTADRTTAFARYEYLNPERPSPGNQQAAERAYAEGVRAHQANRLTDAIDAYRLAVRLNPALFNAHYNLGLAAAASGNLPLALSSYETALALRPDYTDARYNFALVLKQAKYPYDAANELEKLLRSNPNESRAHLALGNLYAQQLDKPALARPHYLKVLEIDPRNSQAPTIHYWLAEHPR